MTSAAPQLTILPGDLTDPDATLEMFLDWVSEQGITLYPAQEEAIMAILAGDHAIVSTPTGSGKSLIALAAHYAALCRGERTYYTAPLKALVSVKFFALVEVFGAKNVGMVTGDSSVNAGAPIICCTAEILANIALREGTGADVSQVVMDEFHFFADPQRGWAWQAPLIAAPQAQFVLLSATLGDTEPLEKYLKRHTARTVSTITSVARPVPLDFAYSEVPLGDRIQDLIETGKAPIYIVSFAQAAAVELAQSLTSGNVASREKRDAIAAEIGAFRFATGFGTILSRLLRHGIGVHHAGMLPKYRRLVEHLAQKGLLTVISGTDTLGVGINVPIRTVLLTALTKYDGRSTRHLNAREFHQISGRAGRAGYDTAGTVVLQAPEHIIENQKALAKAGDDAKKRRKIVRKKAPEGFVSWGPASFERVIAATPEPLVGQMRITHSMMLNLLARPHATIDTVRDFIEESLQPESAKLQLKIDALTVGRSLLASGVVTRHDDEHGTWFGLTEDLGPHFALNQPLSPFALAALDLFDRESDDYAMHVVSLIEATVPGPRAVLAAQLRAAKSEAVAGMKADGVEYLERMAVLDEMTWPQPDAELLFVAYDSYAGAHGWVKEFELQPKSIVREMIENAMTFSEFVSRYQLARIEGTFLRYLADCYRALEQNVPQDYRNEQLEDITQWLGELIRQVDSSLLDEWEELSHPTSDAADAAAVAPPPRTFTSNTRAFLTAVRNAMFRRVLLAEKGDYAELGRLDTASGWRAQKWEDAIEPYYDEYDHMGTDNAARSIDYLQIDKGEDSWSVRQIIADPEGDRDWGISATIDLEASDLKGEVVLSIVHVGPLSESAVR